jgi:hypothetical protein
VCRRGHVPAFPPGAFLLKFHPKFSSSLFIVSQNGQIQICEAQGDPTSLQMYQVRVNTSAGHSPNNKFDLRWGVYQADCGGDLVTSFDIASTGECLIFADSGGYILILRYVCAFNPWCALALGRV